MYMLPEIINRQKEKLNIAVIGAGWNGIHTALELAKRGHEVMLFEQGSEIMSGVSGIGGARLSPHGTHYLSSPETRADSTRNFKPFVEMYPDLVISPSYSHYGFGFRDVDNNPPKSSKENFIAVCKETPDAKELDPTQCGYRELQTVFNVPEYYIPLGNYLKSRLMLRLNESKVILELNTPVRAVEKLGNKKVVLTDRGPKEFDHVINTTCFKALLPSKNPLPFEIKIVYQVCVVLHYRDIKPSKDPFSFMVLDFWAPSILPCVEDEAPLRNKYILLHAKWMLSSYSTPLQAEEMKRRVEEKKLVERRIRPLSEKDIIRYWPAFKTRLVYEGHRIVIMPKVCSQYEFRSGLTFQDRDTGMIYAFPGKVSNIFSGFKDIYELLMEGKNILKTPHHNIVENGVLNNAIHEVTAKPTNIAQSTGDLHTFDELLALDEEYIANERKFNKILEEKALQEKALQDQARAQQMARERILQQACTTGENNPIFFLLLSFLMIFLSSVAVYIQDLDFHGRTALFTLCTALMMVRSPVREKSLTDLTESPFGLFSNVNTFPPLIQRTLDCTRRSLYE